MRMNEAFKALADPTRREILRLLRGGEKSAGELAACFDMSKPSVSHHLAALKQVSTCTAVSSSCSPLWVGAGSLCGVDRRMTDDVGLCATCRWMRSVTNRRGFVFCVKPAQRRGFGIQTLPRCCTWAEPASVTSTRWSL